MAGLDGTPPESRDGMIPGAGAKLGTPWEICNSNKEARMKAVFCEQLGGLTCLGCPPQLSHRAPASPLPPAHRGVPGASHLPSRRPAGPRRHRPAAGRHDCRAAGALARPGEGDRWHGEPRARPGERTSGRATGEHGVGGGRRWQRPFALPILRVPAAHSIAAHRALYGHPA